MFMYFKLLVIGATLGTSGVFVAIPTATHSDTTIQKPKANPQPAPQPAPSAPVAQVATQSTAKITKAPAKPAPVIFSTNWSATTPTYSQGSLLGGYACSPTSLAMVTAHYHATNHALRTRTPQEFVNNLRPGEFVVGQGVPYNNLARQLVELGYPNLSAHTGTGKAELVQALKTGPIIITAGGNTRGVAGLHSLVVVAISDDASTVIVNDPATGARATLPWANFDRLWAGGSRGILYVRP